MKVNFKNFLRYSESNTLAELFLVNAVGSIIAIRVFLHLTNYPKLDGSGLHIAHMLWGGLLMLIALGLLMFFIDKVPRFLAAIFGGLGFGIFIDELGKFITRDNNYFFKPTFALIYLIFIIIYFIFRWVFESKPLTRDEYLANSLEILKEGIDGDLDIGQKKRFQKYLNKSRASFRIKKEFNDLLNHITIKAARKPGVYSQLKSFIFKIYSFLVKRKWFLSAVVLFFILRVFVIIGVVVFLLFQLDFSCPEYSACDYFNQINKTISQFNFYDWGSLITSGLINLLVLFGLLKIRRSFFGAVIYFRYSVLMSIFFYQFFSFYHHQLLAVIGVFIDITLLYILNFMISQNGSKNKHSLEDSEQRRI